MRKGLFQWEGTAWALSGSRTAWHLPESVPSSVLECRVQGKVVRDQTGEKARTRNRRAWLLGSLVIWGSFQYVVTKGWDMLLVGSLWWYWRIYLTGTRLGAEKPIWSWPRSGLGEPWVGQSQEGENKWSTFQEGFWRMWWLVERRADTVMVPRFLLWVIRWWKLYKVGKAIKSIGKYADLWIWSSRKDPDL